MELQGRIANNFVCILTAMKITHISLYSYNLFYRVYVIRSKMVPSFKLLLNLNTASF